MRSRRLIVMIFLLALTGSAAEIRVMISGGFSGAFATLAPQFESETGATIVIIRGPSMGETPEAIPNRLARGEAADVVIMVSTALDLLAADGKVRPGTKVDLVHSRIALAVKAGAPIPDISTAEAFRQTLRKAKSVAYSDSASGVYISEELFKRLGIAAEMKPRSAMIPGTPVGLNVARGEFEIGMQQLSELLPIPGIRVVGLIPADLQKITVYSAGITTQSKSPETARRLIEYLMSAKAWAVIEGAGLEPVKGPKKE